MARKIVLIFTAVALPLLLVVTMESGVAQAAPVFPGTVTCGSGAWSGSIRFTPPLRSTGTAGSETFTVSARLGNSANGCPGTTGVVYQGAIRGKLRFNVTNANNCATIFSGTALVPVPASKFKLSWINPVGAPTHWKQPPPFSVVGAAAMTNITVTGGKVTGSFSPYPTPIATLSDATWNAVNIGTACSSSSGLTSLPLGTSTGTW